MTGIVVVVIVAVLLLVVPLVVLSQRSTRTDRHRPPSPSGTIVNVSVNDIGREGGGGGP